MAGSRRLTARTVKKGRFADHEVTFGRSGQTLPPSHAPEVYARWLFDFLKTDLASLTEGQLLGMRLDAYWFTQPELVNVDDTHWADTDGLPTTATLERLRQDVLDGIKRLRAGEWWTLEHGVGSGVAVNYGKLVTGCRRGTFSDLFRDAVMDTLQMFWAQVRDCPVCGAPFLKEGKRVYCSSRCANLAHWNAYKDRTGKNQRHRDYHAEYERRVQKRLGRVKVGRRRKR